jgi:hypothetical protein
METQMIDKISRFCALDDFNALGARRSSCAFLEKEAALCISCTKPEARRGAP